MATIKRRGKSYLFRVYAGYDINGKQIERTKTWTPPPGLSEKQADKEASHQAALFEESVRNGSGGSGKMKFADFAELWLSQYAEKNLRPRTVASYQSILKQVNPVLGHFQIEKIRPANILEFYSSLSESEPKNSTYICSTDLKAKLKQIGMTKDKLSKTSGVSLSTINSIYHGKAISYNCAQKICVSLNLPLSSLFRPVNPGKTVSPATIQHYHHLISTILETAVKWQYISENPCSRITPPKSPQADILYLDDAQSKELLKLLSREPGYYRRPVSLLLFTGMRCGELMGLEWRDIDWDNKTIRIERTVQYIAGKGCFTDSTKNDSSNRTIYVSDQVIEVLYEQAVWQQTQKQLLKDKWLSSPRVVVDPDGKPMRADRLRHWFGNFIKKTDLPQIHLHSLRHTYATLCIAKGVPLTTVAAQLGHANVSTTTNIYAHAIKSSQISAANKIGEIFGEIL